jgi:CRISPR-associated endonuclease/helicase Cas3
MTMLPSLEVSEFAAVFEALEGHAPFPWQVRLAERLCAGERWPRLIDLPTGAGKTAVLDIALFHLAIEADKGEARRAALRIALVVDRRIVVDDAYERARRMARRLREAEPGSLLARTAARLRHIAGPGAPPVSAHRLRGGLPLDVDWARSLRQPTLLTSTIDQIGSRLLFRGYGVSDRMKPVHAGLLGSDCLILIDEAHLAEPFRQTLELVARYRVGPRSTGADPWDHAVLSATPGREEASRFGLTEEELSADPKGSSPASLLRRRLLAAKPVRLAEPAKDLVGEATREALEMLQRLRARGLATPALGVIVNRVARARAIFEALAKAAATGDGEASFDVELLIGPSRPLDRSTVVETLGPIRTGGARTLERPLLVVATQCIEVGADLDFDGLVTECAPLDTLRQRFG